MLIYKRKLSRRDLLSHLFQHTSVLATLLLTSANVFSENNVTDDAEARRAAQFVMRFGSPYFSKLWRTSPHMHFQLKRNIELLSKGKIYVDIQDGGKAGIGPQLMARVYRGHIDAALISVSNLAPAAPALDILNIPFWSAEDQSYLNLITSRIWKSMALDPVQKEGALEVLFHYLPGSRTATTVKPLDKAIKRPDDLKNIIFRVPSSKVLATFYRMAQARVVRVDWGDVARMVRNERIQALDPGTIGLFNGPDGLNQHLSVISEIGSVHDGWMAVVSQAWLKKIPEPLREAVFEAGEITFREVIRVRQYCEEGLRQLGTTIYKPTQDEKQAWKSAFGHQRPEWAFFKAQFLGNAKLFDKLEDATFHNNGYTMSSDVQKR